MNSKIYVKQIRLCDVTCSAVCLWLTFRRTSKLLRADGRLPKYKWLPILR